METPDVRAARPPLEHVLREAPFALRSAQPDDAPGDGLRMDGYGAVFGSLTVIDSFEGRFRERIAVGAMKRSFRESPPKVQFDHGRHPMIGSIPIAKLERIAEEIDPQFAPQGGAHIVARIFDNWLMQPVRDAHEDGALNGMSFRFSVVRESWETADGKPIRSEPELLSLLDATRFGDVPDDELPIRTLKELKVPEMGPVVWPAYSDTSVGVRSIDLGRLRQGDPEQRRLLAEALFIADTASREETAQRDAGDTPAVERPAESDDAQRSTSGPAPLVGEHPSKKRRAKERAIDLAQVRTSMKSIYQKKGS